MATDVKTGRCVHCLGEFPEAEMTEDHVPPRCWYPDTTPSAIQYLKVPSCNECNGDYGKMERDLLIRFGLCVEPGKSETSGLAERALRTLGIDAGDLSETERGHRDRARARIRKELMLPSDVSETFIRGLGRPESSAPEVSALPIAYADLSLIAEKMARGCEYRRARRYVELPYGLRTFIGDPAAFSSAPAKLLSEVGGEEVRFDLGPGFKVTYVFSPQHPSNVAYWFLLWGTLCLSVLVTREETLKAAEPAFQRPPGLSHEDLVRRRKFPTS